MKTESAGGFPALELGAKAANLAWPGGSPRPVGDRARGQRDPLPQNLLVSSRIAVSSSRDPRLYVSRD